MKRALVLILSALALASCASKPDKTDPNAVPVITNPYSLEGTTIPVGVIPAATLHDARRNRDVDFSIEYPTRGGPYPLVIFSPEYGGSRASYVGLSAFWAGHGYVVIKPSHADAGATRAAVEQRMAEQRERMGNQQNRGQRGGRDPRQDSGQFQNLPFRADPSTAWETAQTQADWVTRAADVRLILDSLPRLIEQYPEIKDRLDSTRIGIGGHAYGALTALMTAGVSGTPDPRVKAVEAMSPPGALPDRGLTSQSFANLHVPALFLTGSRDFGALQSEDLAWRKQGFEATTAGDKWFVSIQGAGRSAFTGAVGDFGGYQASQPVDMPYPTGRPPIGGSYPQPQPMPSNNRGPVIMAGPSTGSVRTISLAFWDAYLKNDTAGREYLDKLKSRGDVQVETK